jgi:hypothetical protein
MFTPNPQGTKKYGTGSTQRQVPYLNTLPTGSAPRPFVSPTGSLQPLPTGSAPSLGQNPVINNVIIATINNTNQRVGYFKIDLYNTKPNLYGEAVEKWYYPPVEVKCMLERGDVTNVDTEYGVDVNQTLTIKVPIDTFQTTYNFTPEVGDIVSESERYYEVSSINRSVITIPSGTPGGIASQTIMYVLSAYLTRTSKLNLIKYST